ncbi:MAG TPA: YSC84-related protein [Kofleriaceae bacterium]|nr:YSC84-related protein [Kofleriaceae bacterium]
MRKTSIISAGIIGACAAAISTAACATAPETRAEARAEEDSLESQARATLEHMKARDARLGELLDGSVGYAVFPEIGKGGVIVGGAFGRGVVFEKGAPVGYVKLSQGSVGAQLGGQTFAELIVFNDQKALTRLKTDNFDISANASAVAIKSGAASTVQFEGGAAVFIMPRGGLMLDVSVAGQRIEFDRRGDRS